MAAISDSEWLLLERCRRGERKAFEELVSLYQRRVFGVAYGIVRNPNDALDLCQETFLRAFRSIGRFKGDSRLYTWLYRIAVNVSLDFVGRRKRDSTVVFDETRQVEPELSDEWPSSAGGLGPVEELDRKELMQVMSGALEKLSPKHRAVLVLREVEELSYEEIAETLDINVGTVMSRLFNARRNMQKLLQAYMKGESSR